jgi:hypothetical protein
VSVIYSDPIRLSSIIGLLEVLTVMLFTYALLSMYNNPFLQKRFHSETVVTDRSSIIINCHYIIINIKRGIATQSKKFYH